MFKSITEAVYEILNIKDVYETPHEMLALLYDKERREKAFTRFLNEYSRDLSRDWFNEYFMENHADKRDKAQFFTPHEVSVLAARLAGAANINCDICSGSGSMTIQKWETDRLANNPFKYQPSDYLYFCEELSVAALPFLLFNLLIRGMNAAVIHTDVLRRECFGVFFIQNDKDDFMGFSSLNLCPYSEDVEKFFNVKFGERKYSPIIESALPDYLKKKVVSINDCIR